MSQQSAEANLPLRRGVVTVIGETAVIVGTEKAMRDLRAAIDQALTEQINAEAGKDTALLVANRSVSGVGLRVLFGFEVDTLAMTAHDVYQVLGELEEEEADA